MMRMYLVLRRGAIETLGEAGALAGAAAVRCTRAFEVPEAWRERPRKVCLRARNPAQWESVLELPHALAGERDGAAVAALPPQEPAPPGTLVAKLQAMSGDLEPPPREASAPPGTLTYVLNPAAPMSSGKTLAQIAHAAVMAADEGLAGWVAAGCPAIVVAPGEHGFAAAEASERCVARVIDAGLTELPPGTLTVLALR
jgi:peptidyl-tRNA hydrolase PTH2